MAKENEMKDVYSKLKGLRRARGLTVHKLAEEIGVNHQKVGRIERGQRTLTIDYLMKISKALDTSVDSILSEESNSPQNDKKQQKETAILIKIVTLVDKHSKMLFSDPNSEKKGEVVSKIYGSVQNLPVAHQESFVNTLFELLKMIQA